MTDKKDYTIKELSEIMQVSRDTIERSIRKIYPDKMKNGITTMLNEVEITVVKKDIESNNNFRNLAEVKTELDYEIMAKQVEAYRDRKIKELTEKNEKLKLDNQKLLSDNELLSHSSRTYTTGQIAKEIGLRSAQELNKKLVEEKIIYKKDNAYLPYSDYADKGYMDIKQEIVHDIEIYHSKWTQVGREFLIKRYKDIKPIGFVENYEMAGVKVLN